MKSISSAAGVSGKVGLQHFATASPAMSASDHARQIYFSKTSYLSTCQFVPALSLSVLHIEVHQSAMLPHTPAITQSSISAAGLIKFRLHVVYCKKQLFRP